MQIALVLNFCCFSFVSSCSPSIYVAKGVFILGNRLSTVPASEFHLNLTPECVLMSWVFSVVVCDVRYIPGIVVSDCRNGM